MDRSEDQAAGENTPLLAAAGSIVGPAASPAETATLVGSRPQSAGLTAAAVGNGYGTSPGAAEEEGLAAEAEDDSIPGTQVFLLCLARLVEPTVFFSIFPYINEMVKRSGGLDDVDVGFYTGLIESLFSLTQACVMIFWGRLSDRAGRRRVLIVSLAGVTVAASVFGLARTIPQMIVLRCVGGLFAGTPVTVRTMLAEHSNPRTQARIFSWFAFAGNLGIFLGPLLGGALADPAGQYGGVFARVRFFSDYPYALPNFVVGILSAVATATSVLYVEDTLKPRESKPASGGGEAEEPGAVAASNGVSKTAAATATAAEKIEDESIWKLLNEPGVAPVLYNSLILGVLAFAYTAIISLWWFTPIELGGFGWDPLQISIMIAFNGIMQAIWLLGIFPPMQRRYGTNGVMRICGVAYPFLFLLCPLYNMLLRAGQETAFWVFFPIGLGLSCGVSMSFTAQQLAINDVSPSPRVLGTITAVSLVISAGTRAVCPGLATSLFALGAKSQLFGGYAIWFGLALVAVGFAVATRFLPDYDELKRERAEREREAAAPVASGSRD